MEQLLAQIAADAGHHLAEDDEALFLVFLLGILLPIAAQTDAFTQGLHVLQVLDPALVDLFLNEVAEEVEEVGQPKLLLARLDDLLELFPGQCRQLVAFQEALALDGGLKAEAFLHAGCQGL